MKRVFGIVAALGTVVTLGVVVYFPSSAGSSATATLIDVPIRFSVRDVNESALRCPASGKKYTIAGRLIAPSSGIGSATTVYLSGVIFSGLYEFHNDLVPGYNFTRELAKLGHTSVVIDRLGYGKTVPYPSDGRQVCIGGLADALHQVIASLLAGRYSVVGSSASVRPKEFKRVAAAGYSLGGVIAELEQASWLDQSALVLLSWADQGFSKFGTGPKYLFSHCSPGRPKWPGGFRGYYRVLPPEKVPPLLSRAADRRILATFRKHEELDPCGQTLTGQQWFAGLARAAYTRIKIPVLIMYGEYDILFNRSAWAPQWDHFSETHDRTLVGIPDGQMLMLDRHVPLTRRILSTWLALHGL